MATGFGFEGDRLALAIDRLLRFEDSRNGLEANPKSNVLTVRDSPLYTARAIRMGLHVALLIDVELIVVLGAAHCACAEAFTDFEASRGRKAHHGFRQVGMKLVKNGLSKSRLQSFHDTANGSTEAVALFLGFKNT